MTAVSYDVSTPSATRTVVATFADRRRTIVGPVGDLVWIYGSPIWALGLVHLLLAVPFLNREVIIGEPTSIVVFLLAAITFAHLLPVFVRSHMNRKILASYRWRLLVVPPVLIATITIWPPALIVAGVIAAFWDVYHTAQQNFGLGRIYDARAGVASEATRRADRLISHVLYLGPIMAGASLFDHLDELKSLDGVGGWRLLAGTPDSVRPWTVALRWIVVAVMVVAVVLYVRHNLTLARRGVRSSPHKVALMVISAVIQIAAWGLSSPIVAFMVVNLYHAVQYFALVWHIEGRTVAGQVGLRSRRVAVPFGLLAVFAVPAVFGLLESGWVTYPTFVGALFLSVSLLHFWMDGFIWSVRTNSV